MRKGNAFEGHLMAGITAVIWGMTFVSSKMLLNSFTAVEIIFFRFLLAYLALWIIRPRIFHSGSVKRELGLAFAGLMGVTVYFIFETLALSYTNASNVGIIVSVAPMLTAILAGLSRKGDRPTKGFFLGFVVAIIGIAFISFNGAWVLHLNPVGDLLTLGAALAWAIYSVVTVAVTSRGDDTLLVTRRIFFYGLIFMIPALFFMDFRLGIQRFAVTSNLLNMLFLGLVASALCYILWNRAFNILGPVKTNVYIYLSPVVTVAGSALILKEQITWMAIVGAVLTLIGMWFSQHSRRNM